MMDVDTIANKKNVVLHPKFSNPNASNGVIKAGPIPQDAKTTPIATPNLLRNHVIDAGTNGTKIIDCEMPKNNPNTIQ